MRGRRLGSRKQAPQLNVFYGFSQEKFVLDFNAPTRYGFSFWAPRKRVRPTPCDDAVGAVVRCASDAVPVRVAVGATPAALFQRHKLQPTLTVERYASGVYWLQWEEK